MQKLSRWLVLALGLAAPVQAQHPPGTVPSGPAGPPPQVEAAPPEGERREEREEEPIETDRDSFTPTTRTVGRDRLVFESAYSFLDNRGFPETHSFPELLLRYGVAKRLELRLGWNHEVGGGGSDVSGSLGDESAEPALGGTGITREYRVAYGFKAELTDQEAWRPESAFILQGLTPTGGDAKATQVVATYVFGWELPERWKADAAIRYSTGSEEGDHFGVWAPSVVLKVPLGERWNVHGEYFGLFSRGKEFDSVKHYVSPGAHYLITQDLEVGVRLGWGLNDQAARFFMNVGGGWRF
jgi:hypothetical protein